MEWINKNRKGTMQIEELRVGNWIEYKSEEQQKGKKENEWSKDKIASFMDSNRVELDGGEIVNLSEVRFINLHDWVFLSSKQILQNPSVFTVLSQTPPRETSYYAEDGALRFVQNKSHKWVAKFVTDEGRKQKTLYYVHELQNFYYDLTLEELIVNV